MGLGLGLKLGDARGFGVPYPTLSSITTLARWSALYSTCKSARDGSGAVCADLGSIGHWADLSGSGNHATCDQDSVRPVWHGRVLDHYDQRGVFFDNSANRRLYSTGVATALSGASPVSMTVAIAHHLDGRDPRVDCPFALEGSDPSLMRITYSGTGSPRINCFQVNSAGTLTGNHTNTVAHSGPSNAHVLIFTYNATTGALKLWRNGQDISAGLGTFATSGAFAYTHFTLGGRWDGTAQNNVYQGMFYEVVVGLGVISEAERQDLERYLMAQINVPYTPNMTPARRHLVMFDSHANMPWKDYTTQRFDHVARRLFRRLNANEQVMSMSAVVGAGIDSGTAPVATTQWAAEKGDLTSGTASNDTNADWLLSIGCGNDLRSDGTVTDNATAETNAATEFAKYDNIIEEANDTKYCPVILRSVAPQGSGAVTVYRAHGIDYFNHSLLAPWCGKRDRAAYVETFNLLKNPGDNFLAATYDNGDGLHLNAAGWQVCADAEYLAYQHLKTDPRRHANLVRWYTARNHLAATSGAALAQLNDRSATAAHATQATGANQPLYINNVANYRPAIRPDGTNDFYSCAEFGDYEECTFILVIGSGSNYRPLLGHSTLTGSALSVGDDAVGITYPGLSIQWQHLGAFATGDVIAIRWKTAPPYRQAWVNGQAMGVSFSSWGDGLSMGSIFDRLFSDTAAFFDHDLFDLLVYDAGLSDSDLNEQAGYIAFKHGKTWQT